MTSDRADPYRSQWAAKVSLNARIRHQLLEQLATESAGNVAQLNNALRLLAKWRSVLIQNTLLHRQGTVVMQGPLKGLTFLDQSAEGCHIAKLLGCYEQPLQPWIEKAIEASYPTILNIGCAEGYYAVGMVRRMPHTHMHAHDLSPQAQQSCIALACTNHVRERVTVGGLFRPEDFAGFTSSADRRLLVLCDVEGAERELLDPAMSQALCSMDLIVESHECLVPGITSTLIERFGASHRVTQVHDNGQRRLENAPEWFCKLAHLDQLLATWQWRSGATPWLVMHAKRP